MVARGLGGLILLLKLSEQWDPRSEGRQPRVLINLLRLMRWLRGGGQLASGGQRSLPQRVDAEVERMPAPPGAGAAALLFRRPAFGPRAAAAQRAGERAGAADLPARRGSAAPPPPLRARGAGRARETRAFLPRRLLPFGGPGRQPAALRRRLRRGLGPRLADAGEHPPAAPADPLLAAPRPPAAARPLGPLPDSRPLGD